MRTKVVDVTDRNPAVPVAQHGCTVTCVNGLSSFARRIQLHRELRGNPCRDPSFHGESEYLSEERKWCSVTLSKDEKANMTRLCAVHT